MVFLARSVCYNSPPTTWFNTISGSNLVKHLVWAWSSLDMRYGYQTAICSYEYFALYRDFKFWPATREWLEEWTSTRIMGWQVRPSFFQDCTVLRFIALSLSFWSRNALTTVWKAAAQPSHSKRQMVFSPHKNCLPTHYEENFPQNYQTSIN